MKGRVRVLRGEIWAQRLMAQLELPPADAGEWMEQHTQILKSGRDTLSGLLRIDDDVCFLKLYRPGTLFHRMLFSVGRGRAQRNYSVARDLAADGLAVPLPLACLSVHKGVFLLIEGMIGEGNLVELWRQGLDEDKAHRIIRSAGETLAMLHRSGFAHGDCKWENLIWNRQRVYLVDLDEVRKCKAGSSLQAHDLARFTISAEELSIGLPCYEQFLDAYLEGVGQPRRDVMNRMLPHLFRMRSQHVGNGLQRTQRLV